MDNRKLYRQYMAEGLRANSIAIADQWLKKLEDVVLEETRDVFPTEHYLDHIPSLIDEIAGVLEQSLSGHAMSNSLIERTARNLGQLRHQQKATVNQLLREYDLLAEVLEAYMVEHTEHYTGDVSHGTIMRCMASVARIVNAILQATVDTFVELYMGTIHEQTEKIASFNKFVSHELKTPLQAALLNLELILENKDPTDADTQDLLRVQSSVQQSSLMLQNVEKLTQNAPLPTHDNPVQQEVDISAVLRDIVSQLDTSAGDKTVDITIDDDLGFSMIETGKLKLVFTNVLTNAIKYSDPQKLKNSVKVSACPNAKSGFLGVIVEDNGVGIAPEMQDDVFKFRVRAHTSDEDMGDVSGYGLGLYLVSEAMRELGGNIELESAVGEGTSVRLYFPQTQTL